ncbi:MAG TPA: primosomal protein N' [Terriglobia bacterium]|nr:primosomal protein N' [Terriglobia bacterium]
MPHKKDNLVEVAVMAPIPRALTYRVPPRLELRAGQRVFVPLGRRRAQGIVLEPVASMAAGVEARDVLDVVDPEPLLAPELLTLGLWIAEYYVAPPGEVFRGMLPLLQETRRAERLEITPAGRTRLEYLVERLCDAALARAEASGSPGSAAIMAAGKSGAPPAEPGAGASDSNSDAGGAEGGQDARAPSPENALDRERQFLEALVKRPVSISIARKHYGADVVERAQQEGWAELHNVEEKRARRTVLAVRLAGPLPEHLPRLSKGARRILDALAAPAARPEDAGAEVRDHRPLLKSARGSIANLRQLEIAGLVSIEDRSAFGPPVATGSEAEDEFGVPVDGSRFELTVAQAAAFADLSQRLDARKFSTTLLYGVTGSGKTELYLRLIARALEQNRTALMLVPEISLTPAVRALFISRFGKDVAVLHSGLARGERHQSWWRAARGEARVVLGTRSAVFAPVANLGLVIVDEEHDASYKQDETPRYHGRDVAVVRARLAGGLCVLGSATPSLESYGNVERGKYALAKLAGRVAGRPLATVEVVDMRAEFRQTFSKIPVSRRLQAEIEAQLARREQTIILLNRRGYSWYLLCRSCGQSPECVNCSISLTYHRAEHRLVCHYCGYSIPVPSRCPSCQSEYIYYVGEGTEKIEDKFRELFPTARVERLDRDVARRPGHFEKVLGRFRRGEIDILIGTQLVSKGHDFPGVTLVGVVSADQGLRLPDFRAAERTFQLLTQVAGRSGRGAIPGRVLVQTFYPEHYAIRLAAEQNYEGFFAKEMRFRRMTRYPPVTALARIVAQHPKLEKTVEAARHIERYLQRAVEAAGDQGPGAGGQGSGEEADTGSARSGERASRLGPFRFAILGPGPAPIARIQGRHRIQFLIKAASRTELNRLLGGLALHLEAERIPPPSVLIDMDPVSVM